MATPRDLRQQEVEKDKDKIIEHDDGTLEAEPLKGNANNVFERLEKMLIIHKNR